jgi:hypothetical protein
MTETTMPPAHIRILAPIVIAIVAACDSGNVPKGCRNDDGLRSVKAAEATVTQAETAVVRARMMGPSPHIQNVRPPDFEPDPVVARAMAALRYARFKLAQAVARCRDGGP